MPDVFISYKRSVERESLVRRLALILRSQELTVWWDASLDSGGEFDPEIQKTIEQSSVVVPIWCSASIYSDWVIKEAGLGKGRLLPINIQTVTPPKEFMHLNASDFVGWNGDVKDPRVLKFIQTVQRRLNRPARLFHDMVMALSELPTLPALPAFNEEANQLLSWLRKIYIRQHREVTVEDALAITDETTLEQFLERGTGTDLERVHAMAEATEEPYMLLDANGESVLYDDDLSDCPTVGRLIDLILTRKRDAQEQLDNRWGRYDDREQF